MGCGNMHISELRPSEAVLLNGDRLEEICRDLGYRGGEAAISTTLEDLAGLLSQARSFWEQDDLSALDLCAGQVVRLSDRVGMAGLSRSARNVRDLCGRPDAVALAATVARMRRIGEQSLLAIWDRQDLII